MWVGNLSFRNEGKRKTIQDDQTEGIRGDWISLLRDTYARTTSKSKGRLLLSC